VCLPGVLLSRLFFTLYVPTLPKLYWVYRSWSYRERWQEVSFSEYSFPWLNITFYQLHSIGILWVLFQLLKEQHKSSPLSYDFTVVTFIIIESLCHPIVLKHAGSVQQVNSCTYTHSSHHPIFISYTNTNTWSLNPQPVLLRVRVHSATIRDEQSSLTNDWNEGWQGERGASEVGGVSQIWKVCLGSHEVR